MVASPGSFCQSPTTRSIPWPTNCTPNFWASNLLATLGDDIGIYFVQIAVKRPLFKRKIIWFQTVWWFGCYPMPPPKTTIGPIGLLWARHLFRGFSVGFGGWHLVRGYLLLHHCRTPATNASAKGFGRGSSPPNPNTTLVLHRIRNGRDGLAEDFLQECE